LSLSAEIRPIRVPPRSIPQRWSVTELRSDGESLDEDVRVAEEEGGPVRADLPDRLQRLEVHDPVDLVPGTDDIACVEEGIADPETEILVELVAGIEGKFRHHAKPIAMVRASIARLDQEAAVECRRDRPVRLDHAGEGVDLGVLPVGSQGDLGRRLE